MPYCEYKEIKVENIKTPFGVNLGMNAVLKTGANYIFSLQKVSHTP